MAKSGGSLGRGRRSAAEVPDMPAAGLLIPNDAEAQQVLGKLVATAGGRFGTRSPVPVPTSAEGLGVLADRFERWADPHLITTENDRYFPGRPGFWHALDELVPLQDPNRWDKLRYAVIEVLQERGWVRRTPPRGAGFDLPS